jgi:hypothetical protein
LLGSSVGETIGRSNMELGMVSKTWQATIVVKIDIR